VLGVRRDPSTQAPSDQEHRAFVTCAAEQQLLRSGSTQSLVFLQSLLLGWSVAIPGTGTRHGISARSAQAQPVASAACCLE
jgi:hypothetical protein